MPLMGYVGQMKLACAIKVEMKHLERSYSTLCCSVSHICSFVTPSPCVHMHLRNAIHYVCDGICESREACMCNKGLKEAFGEKLFNFMLFSFRYLVLCHPIFLRSHAFVAMQSIMLTMESVGRKKLQVQ